MITGALTIALSVFLAIAILAGSVSVFGGEPASFINVTSAISDKQKAIVIFSEYWSEDGYWVTEGRIGEDKISVTVYESANGILKQISRETKELPIFEPHIIRGPNIQKEIFEKWAPAVARIESPGGLGSGIIFSTDGLILTNRHVVLNSHNVFVSFYQLKDNEGKLKKFQARVIAVDKVRDLALIKVKNPPQGLKVFTLDTNVQVNPGDQLFSIGHPLGEDWTPTQGVVSVVRKDYEWDHRFTRNKADVIQFQTPISPGSSGGPLLDSNGNLVGISTFVKPGGQNINFAVHITEIKKFVDNKEKYSEDDVHDWLPVSSEMKKEFERRGIKKAQQCDFENDGVIDIVRFDSDNNGDWDRMFMDINCDSEFEFMAVDLNEDGYYESLLLEMSGDNEPDYVFYENPPIRIPVAVKYLRHDK